MCGVNCLVGVLVFVGVGYVYGFLVFGDGVVCYLDVFVV